MRRRDVLMALGGAAALWPLSTLAQTSAVPVIGFLNAQKSADFGHVVRAFHRGLNEGGFIEGKNVNIEYRWAEGRYDRLAALAADLVTRRVNVIAATGGDASARAAKAATTEIPVVFTIGGDPVDLGLVASFNRPGGNLTGLTQYTAALEGKRLEVLHELMPSASAVAMLVDPGNPNIGVQLRDLPTAAQKMNMQLTILRASSEREIDEVFATFDRPKFQALFVASDPFFNSRREQIVARVGAVSIPAIFHQREFVTAGGLISYGSSALDMYRQAGLYAARILKGAKPTELPVLQPTKFELVINLKTAKTLGVVVPPSLLTQADEVIE
jgi:putative ABC transport system substrate-binding protein